MRRWFETTTAVAATALLMVSCARKPAVSPEEAQAIAREATVYGYALVENYKVMYASAVNEDDPEYRGPFNRLFHTARVFTPDDRVVQTPNSDTPYSMMAADLRAEPLVLSVPAIEEGRYYSIQLIDMYTHNFDYIGTRATGSRAGSYLLVGPSWSGETPAGIAKVIRCETEFASAIYRTQLFSPEDIENVKAIQAQYAVQPLSAFLATPAPAAPPAVDFIPYDPELVKTAGMLSYLNFILQFCPVDPSETELRARFAKIGIEPGKPFDLAAMDEPVRAAVEAGFAEGMADIDAAIEGGASMGDSFGNRAQLKNNYLNRAVAAKWGLYGNSREEALYPFYRTDDTGALLDGSHKYTLHFDKGAYPPARAFWSVTMYDDRTKLLAANPINRYLINSPMLPNLELDSDGGLTIYVQNAPPGKDREANWLPAPAGPFYMAMRLYYPEQSALDGTWTAPPLVRVE